MMIYRRVNDIEPLCLTLCGFFFPNILTLPGKT